MSELRESYLQERISKVLEKQKKNNSICIKRTLPPIKYIADDVIKRKNEEEKEFIEITEDNINQRLYTFTKNREEKIEEILKELWKKPSFIFNKLFSPKKRSKVEIVTAFLSLLELSKMSRIQVSQDKLFGDINVVKLKKQR